MVRFLFYATDAFDDVWRRRQHLAVNLARLGHEVIYVEPPRTWAQVLGKAPDTSLVQTPYQQKEAAGVTVTRTVHPLPWIGRAWARRFNLRLDASYLKRMLSSGKTAVVWLTNPLHGPLARALRPHATVVADMTDRWSAFDCNRHWAAELDAEQSHLVRQAHRVAAVSEDLAAFVRQSDPAKTPLLLPNGVSEDMFVPQPAPNWVRALPRPLAVYVGTLEDRVDFDLLGELARALPQVTFALVGPVATQSPALAKLLAMSNVTATGPKPHLQAVAAVQRADITLLLHHDNPLTRSMHPLKLMEYLAAGKPVVATPVGGVGEVSSLLYPVTDAPQAIAAAQKALVGEAPELAAKRRDYAQQHTWRHRAQEICEWLKL